MSHLDQATHAAETAETTFLKTVEQTDCSSQFFSGAYVYATKATVYDELNNEAAAAQADARKAAEAKAKDSPVKAAAARQAGLNAKEAAASVPEFAIAQYCSPGIINDSQITVRTQMMDALALYADKLLALSTNNDNKQLDTNAETLAGTLKQAATNGGVRLSSGNANLVAGVTAAFTAIAEMVIDQRKYKSVVAAATNMQPHIDNVVTALMKENYGYAQAVIAAHTVLEGQLRLIIASAPGLTAKFDEILWSRDVLVSSTGASIDQLATTSWNAIDLSKPLNDVLVTIPVANKAVSSGSAGGVYSAAHDLYERATVAKNVYAAINK